MIIPMPIDDDQLIEEDVITVTITITTIIIIIIVTIITVRELEYTEWKQTSSVQQLLMDQLVQVAILIDFRT